MCLDGLEDAYEPGRLMGSFAEETAAEYQFTRADQDAFAIASLERAQQAQKSGAFDREIAPVEVATRKGITTIALRSEEHTSEFQSLMRISYAVFCLKKKKK